MQWILVYAANGQAQLWLLIDDRPVKQAIFNEGEDYVARAHQLWGAPVAIVREKKRDN